MRPTRQSLSQRYGIPERSLEKQREAVCVLHARHHLVLLVSCSRISLWDSMPQTLRLPRPPCGLAMTRNRSVLFGKQIFLIVFSCFRLESTSAFPAKPTDSVIARRARAPDVAIFKPKVWHPGAKHGSGKPTKSRIFDPSRRDTDTALLWKRHFARAQARISHASAYFTCSESKFHRAAILGQRPNFTAQPRRRIALHFPVASTPSACYTYRAPRRNFLSFVRYSCIPCVAMIY